MKIRWKRLTLILIIGSTIILFPVWYGWLIGGYHEVACVWEYDNGSTDKAFDADCHDDREGGGVVILKGVE